MTCREFWDMVGDYLALSPGSLSTMAQESSTPWQILAAELFLFHDKVTSKVHAEFPWIDCDQVHDAFVKAVLELARKPEKFDSKRGAWPSLLRGATKRTLRDLDRSNKARQQREAKKARADVAESASAARNLLEGLVDAESLHSNLEQAQMVRDEIARTDEERAVLALWERGIDDFGEWARALGVEGLPEEEQQAQVTRARKRLMKRIQRLRRRLAGEVENL